ncbi:epidermal retinol dehydrogenase 2-like [Oppia nitens]|uniref:epidermal retinol dehydrogenase 2-like n=1 Tax=Oppia nitens TaxID=1686743 RepID=UPI0023DAB396|nr:epidermal retinol dehydrogenase 2-like [Oppia nitens]
MLTLILTLILVLLFVCFRYDIIKYIPKSLRYKSIIGENVVITGAGGGLGRLLALQFAKYGANLALIDINSSDLRDTKQLIEKQYKVNIKDYVCDLADRQVVYKTSDKINEDFGFISILVNNAGVLYGKTFLELNDQNIINTFNVNAISNFWTIKSFLPNMLTKNRGHIVNIVSISGLSGVVKQSDYCSSKFAVIGLTESLRYELLKRDNNQIKTTIVCPTFFDTPLVSGVRPTNQITILDPNCVAEQAMDAVLSNKEMIVVPNHLNLIFILKALLPISVFDVIFRFIGGYDVMQHFKGRKY